MCENKFQKIYSEHFNFSALGSGFPNGKPMSTKRSFTYFAECFEPFWHIFTNKQTCIFSIQSLSLVSSTQHILRCKQCSAVCKRLKWNWLFLIFICIFFPSVLPCSRATSKYRQFYISAPHLACIFVILHIYKGSNTNN